MNSPSFSRRHVLAGLSASAFLGRLGSIILSAQTAVTSSNDYKALVCILLAGGNDGHNTVVPLTQADYNTYKLARGGLALPDAITSVPRVPLRGAALDSGRLIDGEKRSGYP